MKIKITNVTEFTLDDHTGYDIEFKMTGHSNMSESEIIHAVAKEANKTNWPGMDINGKTKDGVLTGTVSVYEYVPQDEAEDGDDEDYWNDYYAD